jgi:hypothetical protein
MRGGALGSWWLFARAEEVMRNGRGRGALQVLHLVKERRVKRRQLSAQIPARKGRTRMRK